MPRFSGIPVDQSASGGKFGGIPVESQTANDNGFLASQEHIAKQAGQLGIGALETGVSDVLGAPADIINLVTHPSFGLPESPRPLPSVPFGSQQIKQYLEDKFFGAPSTPEDVQSREAGGEILSALVPRAGLADFPEAGAFAKEAVRPLSRVMPGASERAVRTIKDIGPESNASVLGEKMSTSLRDRFNRLWQARSSEAAKARSAFESDDQAVGPTIKAYQDYLTDLYENGGRDLSTSEKNMILKSSSELAGDRSMLAIDKERRRLQGIMHKGDLQGADANEKILAGQLADHLQSLAESNSPAYKNYIQTYREMSEPINQFIETGLGKKATREVSDRMPDIPFFDPAVLPGNFFKTKHSVELLRQLMGGDDKAVDQMAAEYAASELSRIVAGKKIGVAATQVRDWMDSKQQIWLNYVPRVKAAVEKSVKNIEDTARTQKTAKYTAGGALLLYLAHPVWALRSLIMGM